MRLDVAKFATFLQALAVWAFWQRYATSHSGWTIAYVDSGERSGEEGSAENAIDGQTANFWHTEWKNSSSDHPHQLVVNVGQSQTLAGSRCVPRQGAGCGRIKGYSIYIWNNLVQP